MPGRSIFWKTSAPDLPPGGIVLFNQLGLTEPDKAKAKAFYQEIFLIAFPEGEYWQLGGNVMLVSL